MAKFIYTAGYGNLGFEEFIIRLKTRNITHVVDVRSVPYSTYWQDFRREALDSKVSETGLTYIYMGDSLGAAITSQLDVSESAQKTLEIGLSRLVKASETRTICLMCGCSQPEVCHRGVILGPMLLAVGIDIIHILPNNNQLPHSKVAIHPPQLKLDI